MEISLLAVYSFSTALVGSGAAIVDEFYVGLGLGYEYHNLRVRINRMPPTLEQIIPEARDSIIRKVVGAYQERDRKDRAFRDLSLFGRAGFHVSEFLAMNDFYAQQAYK